MTTQTKTTWRRIKFKDFADTSPSVKLERGKEYPFISMDVVDGQRKFPVEIKRKKFSGGGAKFANGDTIFARITPCLENGKIVKIQGLKEGVGFGSTEFFVFRGKDGISDSDFVYYLSRTDTIRDPAVKSMVGASGRQRADKTVVNSIHVTAPDLPQQKQIASVLSTYDDLIENNARRIQILEQMAQAIYTEWFVDFRFPGHEKVKMVDSGTDFGKIPEGWTVKKIEDVCIRIQAGGTPRRGKDAYWNNGTINWYTTGELQDNFLFGAKEKITEQSINETSAKIFDKGTILMAIYGSPTVGRLGITTERSSCNQAALGLVEDSKKITKIYLYYLLKNLREKFNLEAVGAAQQNISKIKVSETQCLVADRNYIDGFDAIALAVFQELEVLQKQNQNLRQTRDLLLPKLVTGELSISN